MVGRTREDSVNDLQDAVGQRDFKKAIFFLKELLDQGEYHLYLLQSIVGQIRRLVLAKWFIEKELKGKWNPGMSSDAFKKYIYFGIVQKKKREKEEKDKEIADEGGKKIRSSLNIYRLPPDVLLKLLKDTEKFSMEDLCQALRILAETDLKMKSLRLPPAIILEEALMQVCSKQHMSDRYFLQGDLND